MADFCRDCSIELFGEDFKDLANLLPAEKYTADTGASALCEGCGGFISVDIDGVCRATSCLKHGERNRKYLKELSDA